MVFIHNFYSIISEKFYYLCWIRFNNKMPFTFQKLYSGAALINYSEMQLKNKWSVLGDNALTCFIYHSLQLILHLLQFICGCCKVEKHLCHI